MAIGWGLHSNGSALCMRSWGQLPKTPTSPLEWDGELMRLPTISKEHVKELTELRAGLDKVQLEARMRIENGSLLDFVHHWAECSGEDRIRIVYSAILLYEVLRRAALPRILPLVPRQECIREFEYYWESSGNKVEYVTSPEVTSDPTHCLPEVIALLSKGGNHSKPLLHAMCFLLADAH